MVAVADAFDAMISDRPYRRGRSAEEAIAVLRSERDLQFDARVVDALMLCDRAELAGVAAPVYETELSSAAARVL
jgi:HD-GYP domain-containing protein (c-di-GMP phosphodiesterase class II)